VNAETLANDNRDIKLQLASLRFYDLVYDCPTNAGILMFGNNVRYFFPMAYVQFVKFEGTTKASNIQADTQISGDLISMVNELNSFVRINIIKRRPIPISTLIEEDVYNYSESAVREFLMNSLMHRSYEITSYIKFYQFSDRIEIENPGGLYGNARPENFPNVSDYRNLVISESMRVMGYVNRFNRGIEEAQLALKNNKNKPAEFDLDTFGVFRVIIKEKPIEKIKASFSKPWDGVTIKDTDNEIDKNNDGINEALNGAKNGALNKSTDDTQGLESKYYILIEDAKRIKNEALNDDVNGALNKAIISELKKIIKMIHNQKGINRIELIDKIGKGKTTLERYLKVLKEWDLIEYRGSKKTGGYYLTEKAKNKLK